MFKTLDYALAVCLVFVRFLKMMFPDVGRSAISKPRRRSNRGRFDVSQLRINTYHANLPATSHPDYGKWYRS